MPKIFISYRREDSKHAVGRLHAALTRHVRNPKRDIFIDIDNIPRGVDFVDHLDGQVAQCDIMLAVIGPGWLIAKDPQTGKRRLDDPHDFVRIEVASALKRGIPVVPVVLDDTQIPLAADLPDDLRLLARRNGERLEHESFQSDVTRLIRNLPTNQSKLASPEPGAPTPSIFAPRAGGGASWMGPIVALGLLAIGGGAWAWITNPGDWRSANGPERDVRSSEDTSTAVDVSETNPADIAALTPPAAPVVAPPRDAAAAAFAAAASDRPVAERVFRDCDGCPDMVALPIGDFTMGSPAGETGRYSHEGPTRRVAIGYQFAAGRTEVTWDQWAACVADGGCVPLKADGFGGGSRPVTNVNWTEAKAYATWLSTKTRKTYRLLSEAEWEYAARAKTTGAYSFGPTITNQQANFRGGPGKTTPAGQYPANALGLHDMHGNVWEWTLDCFASNYSSGQPSDGRAFEGQTCSYRVFRGGSWGDSPQNLRSANRGRNVPSDRNGDLGFRVARTQN